jgi:chaperonin GroEL (HSP60 family)
MIGLGVVIDSARHRQKRIKKAKVAVFTSSLDVAQTETEGTVLIKNADEMLNFTHGEEKHLEMVSLRSIFPP